MRNSDADPDKAACAPWLRGGTRLALGVGVPPVYRPRDPRAAGYFGVVRAHANTFFEVLSDSGVELPKHVRRRFVAYLGCGDLSRGFLRTRRPDGTHERLVPFSCKARAVCPSCTGKRSAAQTAHLIDSILPDVPIRQWCCRRPSASLPASFARVGHIEDYAPSSRHPQEHTWLADNSRFMSSPTLL